MTRDELKVKIRHALGSSCIEPGPNCDFDEKTNSCERKCPELGRAKADNIMKIIDAYIEGGLYEVYRD